MANPPKVFETAFNTYSVTKVVGEGGSGRVFAVRDTDGEQFALKCLFPDSVNNERRKRFKNEIGFCSKTQHANIIRVQDSGLAEWDNQKCPFYVMTHYPLTLRNLINEKLAQDEILPLFNKILDGVEAAHLLRVIHRDLKPENILCDINRKHIVVADFGIAHFEEEMLLTNIETRRNSRMANFCYSAPEQRTKDGAVDHRAGIFALGLILNELFTGSVPQGAGYLTIESAAKQFAYLDSIVERMIQHKPATRFTSIDEVKKELIGRHHEFVARQRLDTKRGEVVPASSPPVFEGLQLKAVKDWNSRILTLQLNRAPEREWVDTFKKPSEGYSFVGNAAPEAFQFERDTVWIHAEERMIQTFVDHFKRYVEMANRKYEQHLVNRAMRAELAQREKLAQEVAE